MTSNNMSQTLMAKGIHLLVKSVLVPLAVVVTISSCSSNDGELKGEQIRIEIAEATDTIQVNSIQGDSLNQISTTPNSVVLTGLAQHRLVTIYKSTVQPRSADSYSGWRKSYYDESEDESQEHYMPGIDLIRGYNLLNVAHYDFKTEKLNLLFSQPVLIKSLYYPSFVQDSLEEKPISRNFYLLSVYDEDSNGDTLINKIDLRKFYYFSADCSQKTQLIPADHSVVRSQYDPKNDVMYIFAKQDLNKNGAIDKKEPVHIFWIDLKDPQSAKPLYVQ